MQFSRLLPKRFSTRLIAITISSGLIPIIIFGYLINIFDNRFLTQINYAVYQGQEEQWQRSEAVIRKMAEDFIRQKVLDVVLQLELYLQASLEKLLFNPWVKKDTQRFRMLILLLIAFIKIPKQKI
jgi:hypothetical protein